MHNTKGFEKFIKPEIKGAKKKEAIRQEKRKIKKEITEKRWQKIEDRRQMGENRWEKMEDKRHRPEDRSQKIEARRRPPFDRNSKFPKEIRVDKEQGSRFENPKSEIRNSKPETRNFKHRTPNSEPRTPEFRLPTPDYGNMPLNKFIAYCGICGRREAAELVKQGLITVNGDIVFEPGFKVLGNEDVKYKGKRIFLQHNLVYILLNKPKDYLTTAKDPEGRKTVYDLIRNASQERVYSVGRLDRNTTGVLLLTNDGELAQKLTHPSFQIKKIYEVTLDKPLTKHDFEELLNGVTLEDGFIKADAVGFVDAKDKRVIGVEIHSGRNRIVRRIFEHLGYDVRNLDRVMFANLTKKNVDRGKWRMLNEKEVRLLKHMNQSFVRKA